MIDLSIIIVSFNTKDVLLDCIRSIFSNVSEKISYEVIIVDNASNDGSIEALEHESNKLKVILSRENVGFSKANNIGVHQASGKYILFLNPDTIVHKDTIKVVFEFMENHPDAGAATCKLIMPNGKLDDAAHRGFPTPWNAFAHFSGLSRIFSRSKLFSGYSLGYLDLRKTHEIDALAGAFMFTRRKAGEQVGWWDEDFFWYGEDLDFCYRLKQKGWKIHFVPEVSILHYKGVSGGIKKDSKNLSQADEETRKRATKARFEAMRIFYKKHYDRKYPKPVTWFVLLGIKLKYHLSS